MSKIKWLLALSIAGVLFSGYLSGVKFFTSTCALGEGCPYFLGYPACYYGLVMYLVLLISAIVAFASAAKRNSAISVMRVVSGLGILFSGYFTFRELPTLFTKGLSAFVMGLPTCAWGLLMYIIIFALAISYRGNERG